MQGGVHITAMHYCLPNGRVTQSDLETRFTTRQVQSIQKLSGIMERRVVETGQTAADLAAVAAERLLGAVGFPREEIDLLIFCSQTPDHQLPATACVLHERLGLKQACAAFDINQGCAAFPYTLAVAAGYLKLGLGRKALLLNADALSRVVHPLDRGLVTLHGDGACATLLELGGDDLGIEAVRLGTDGTGWKYIAIPASGARMPKGEDESTRKAVVDDSGSVCTQEHLQMNGPAVFQFSISKVPEVIAETLAQNRLTMADLDLVLLHQANKMMLDIIYRKLGVPEQKQFLFSERIGNLGGPSVAVVLAEAWRRGKIKPNSRTLLAGFGNGLAWGVTVIHWPATLPPPVLAPVDF